MVTESFQDGEGELLRRIREVVGNELPIVISLDLHANITEQMVLLSSGICIYRTYPHIDMAETGGRAAILLKRLLNGKMLFKAFRQVPFLITLPAQHTGELGAMGYKYQFITLAGIHNMWYHMFDLTHEYIQKGMTAYVDMVQEPEFAAADRGYTFASHQAEVGAGYFDDVTTVIQGGTSSVTAMKGSGCNNGTAKHLGVREEFLEFDLSITQHIRIWSAPCLILF